MDQPVGHRGSQKWLDTGYGLKIKLTRCSGRLDMSHNSKTIVIDEFRFVCFLVRLFGVTSLEMRKALGRERCGEISGVQFFADGAQGT